MFEHAWQIALLLGTGVLYALLVAQYPRARKEEEEEAENLREEIATDQVDGVGVVCPECGTANEKGFRFCRSCVTELPQPLEVEKAGSTTMAREAQ